MSHVYTKYSRTVEEFEVEVLPVGFLQFLGVQVHYICLQWKDPAECCWGGGVLEADTKCSSLPVSKELQTY